MERIQKLVANRGFCSRRKAEEYLKKGKIKVNGEIVTELGTKVSENDLIEIDGTILGRDEKEYILLYKPRGVITSTSDDKKRKTVLDIVDTNKRLYPVGRLDYDTSGILLLTNDGELTNKLIHPKSEIEKTYVAKVKGFVSKDTLKNLSRGVMIDSYKTAPAKAKLKKYDRKTDTSIVYLTIHEGKNHQVKKMFSALGFECLKLKRETFSFLTLDGLKSGEYRRLTPKEVKLLYNEANIHKNTCN